VRVNDVIRETGLSRATVDRALNRRGGIHPNTERLIRDAYNRLQGVGEGEHVAIGDAPASRTIDAVIRFGRGQTKQVFAVRDRHGHPLELFDMHEKDEDQILDFVTNLCRTSDRPLIIGVKNSEQLSDELARARRTGKRIVTLVSDLNPQARDAYVGIDNRKAGQAAALIVGHGLRHRPAKVGVVLGDYAFRCHEDREIGFRSYLRSMFPNIALTDAAKGDDSAEKTREAVSALVKEHPDIDAIYNVGGGNTGLAEALRESGHAGRVTVVSHETNAITLPLARDGTVAFLIAQSPAALLEAALRAAQSSDPGAPEYNLIDFTIHTKFNIPALDGPLA
jgi:LacI family transcriptional regulator, galactose operon repressor